MERVDPGAGPAGPLNSAPSAPRGAERSAAGKNDLLMRFFESDFFDAWIAAT
jgi:hypothetical protein